MHVRHGVYNLHLGVNLNQGLFGGHDIWGPSLKIQLAIKASC